MTRLLEIPVVGGIVALLIDLVAFGGDLIIQLFISGELVSLLSLSAGILAPRLEWLNQQLLSSLLVLVVLAFIGITVSRFAVQVNND